MKRANLILTFAIMFLSCSKGPRIDLYADPRYPMTIGYLPGITTVDPFLDEKEKLYWVAVDAHLQKEFPKTFRAEMPIGLYNVVIAQTLERFMEYPIVASEFVAEETYFNNIPAIAIKNKEDGEVDEYILLTPGIYAEISLSGLYSYALGGDKPSAELEERTKSLMNELLKHFRWNQKIDITSEEFKAWKAHIWEILKTPREKVKTQ